MAKDRIKERAIQKNQGTRKVPFTVAINEALLERFRARFPKRDVGRPKIGSTEPTMAQVIEVLIADYLEGRFNKP